MTESIHFLAKFKRTRYACLAVTGHAKCIRMKRKVENVYDTFTVRMYTPKLLLLLLSLLRNVNKALRKQL